MSFSVKLNSSSISFLSNLPKVDYTNVSVEDLRKPNPVLDVPGPDVTIECVHMPCRTDGHLIQVDIYRPASAAIDEVLPAVVYL